MLRPSFRRAASVAAIVALVALSAPTSTASAQVAATPVSVFVNANGDLVINDWVGSLDVAGNSVNMVVTGKTVRSSEPMTVGAGCAAAPPNTTHAFALKCNGWKSGLAMANFDDGSDTVDINASKGAYIVGGASADDIIVRSKGWVVVWADMDRGAAVPDWDYQEGHDTVHVVGSATAEVHGGAGNDELYGDRGNDLLFGEDGSDDLHGGKGDDVLEGGGGDFDSIEGGKGRDVMSGGPGDGDSVRYPGGRDVTVSHDGVANDGRKRGSERDNVQDCEYVDTL
ncbi:MAG: calcium-binding protein [Actinomycetota bacterium]